MRAGNSRAAALLVAGAFFMEFLDGTIISTAAPDMAASLHLRPVDIGVTMTAYLVTVAVLIPISGWAADRYGARRVFTSPSGCSPWPHCCAPPPPASRNG